MTINEVGPVFCGSHAVAAGALTRGQLRGPRSRRLCQDIYARSTVRLTHELRCRAFATGLPEGAVITGRSAATVRGVPLCWPEDEVNVVAPLEMRLGRRTGLDVRRTDIAPADWAPGAGWEARHGWRWTCCSGVPSRMPSRISTRCCGPARSGCRRWRRWSRPGPTTASSGHGRPSGWPTHVAESLPESKLRVILTLDGLEPVPQFWLTDERGRIARVDLAFPARRVAIEYDGDRRDGELWALNRDRERLNRVHAIDWNVVFVTAPLLRDRRRLLATVHHALSH